MHLRPTHRIHPKTRTPIHVWNPERRRRLAAEGERVAPSSYWLRRLRDGDVERCEAAAAPTGGRGRRRGSEERGPQSSTADVAKEG